ncbi:MAG: putative lipoprotein YmbA [Gammaproteobacteria bacterium]|jgi:uncharacterized lipoprotein YmbA
MRKAAFIATVCGALVMSGCITGKQPPTRFYVLDPMPASAPALDGAPTNPPLSIDIAALRLPQYLQRPQIVTRTASYELTLDEYHQWGGNLAKNMMSITARNLARLLNTARITVFSRRPPEPPDIRVEIDVLQFERGPDSRVVLSAHWRLLSAKDGKPVVARISDLYSEPINGKSSMQNMVGQMSELMAQLSDEIATAIITHRQ